MITTKEIVEESGMSARPEFYSGRGATLSDLSSRHLEKIWRGIKDNFGAEAAKNFILMVRDIPVLSATNFLKTLCSLERNSWKWRKALLEGRRGRGISFDNTGEAWGTVVSACSKRGDRDDTDRIRNPFLRGHGVRIVRRVEYFLE